MKDKLWKFDALPTDLINKITKNLSNCDLANVALTSKQNLTLFKPMVDHRKLLYYVVRGEREAVQSILAKDISLLFKRGEVTDCSKRVFAKISALEYALWALDKHMWTVMINCIPSNEVGRKILEILIGQYNNIHNTGVMYKLDGETITEKHFDFKNTIIKELQTQVRLLRAPWPHNWDSIQTQWRQGVGGAQKKLPMHVVDEYCSKLESFYPMPEFNKPPKSSKQFYNWRTFTREYWFNPNSKIGVDFGIYKAVGRTAQAGGNRLPQTIQADTLSTEVDLSAMKRLCKIRTKDFMQLKCLLLKEQAALDNPHPPVQI